MTDSDLNVLTKYRLEQANAALEEAEILLSQGKTQVSNTLENTIPAPSNVRGAAYPRVHDDHSVTFRLEAPTATSVQVQIGGPQNAPADLACDDDGTWIGGFSAAVFELPDPETAFDGVLADPAAFNRQVKLFWMSAGTAEEPFIVALRNFHEMLDGLGIEHGTYESQGTSHEWQTWRRSLHAFAPLLFLKE